MIGRHHWKRAAEELILLAKLSLFHPRCRICGVSITSISDKEICGYCRKQIRMCDLSFCRRCGKYLSGQSDICGACSVTPPPFLLHRSYTLYEDPYKQLIHLYKYHQIEPLKHLFASLFLELLIHRTGRAVDGIVPVPADPKRKRDFHPLGEIARILARKYQAPVYLHLLYKKHSTPPQVSLSQKERRLNPIHAYEADSSFRAQGKILLLIDDVYTTGATMQACALALKKTGAGVMALTLAQSTAGFSESPGSFSR